MRYKVRPAGLHYDVWQVLDTQHPTYLDFPVVEIHVSTPNAGKLAYDVADKLNGVS